MTSKHHFEDKLSFLQEEQDFVKSECRRGRSNSECLQASKTFENLLEDPDFIEDCDQSVSDDEDEGQFLNDSCYVSQINYDKYEIQKPILDDLDFSAFNTGTYDKLNSINDDQEQTFQLFFEIRIGSGKSTDEFAN